MTGRNGLQDKTTRQARTGRDAAAGVLGLEGVGAAVHPFRTSRGGRGWTVLGVDPGEQGAAALIRVWPGTARPTLDTLVDADDRKAVRLLARADLVVIEGQQASPQMGVSSAFRLGQAFGGLLEAVEAVARGEVVVTYPAAWRGSYGLAGGKAGKVAGVELVRELLQHQSATSYRPKDGVVVERHDQADAVLLAWWGWRKHLLARALQELQVAGES